MTPDEREILDGFFQRLRQAPPAPQDREAAAAIRQELERNPDLAYRMAQTALVYEQGLAAAQEQIRSLQTQIEARPPARSGGSFLPSVPRVSPAGRGGGFAAGGFGGAHGGGPGGRGMFGGAAGGSFLGSAMSTALGVAGGMALFSGLQSMFSAGTAEAAVPGGEIVDQTNIEENVASPWGSAPADQGGMDQGGMDQAGWDDPGYGDGTGDLGGFDDSNFDF